MSSIRKHSSDAKPKRERVTLSTEQREEVNRDLRDSAWEQSDDESPPRLPRLKRPPEARPLLDDEQPKRLSPSAYKPETINSFCAQGAE